MLREAAQSAVDRGAVMPEETEPTLDTNEQPQTDRSGSRPTAPGLAAWRWPLVVVVLAVVGLLGAREACRAFRATQEAAVEAVEGLTGIAERFHTGTITTTFTAAIPRLVADGGTKLELAAFEAVETFTRSDERRLLFDVVSLGTTVTEIRVPATYRYHLRLEDDWWLEVYDQGCVVHAPPIRPTLPPAIHTDRLEKRSERGWLRFNVEDQMTELERNITPLLERRAADPDNIDLVRETCRRRVAEFVRNWLLAEDHWRQDRFRAVTVIFADEEAVEPTSLPPTLFLEAD
jgi:hypothetical protein